MNLWDEAEGGAVAFKAELTAAAFPEGAPSQAARPQRRSPQTALKPPGWRVNARCMMLPCSWVHTGAASTHGQVLRWQRNDNLPPRETQESAGRAVNLVMALNTGRPARNLKSQMKVGELSGQNYGRARQCSELNPWGSSFSPWENKNTSGMIPIAHTNVPTILMSVTMPGSIESLPQYALR